MITIDFRTAFEISRGIAAYFYTKKAHRIRILMVRSIKDNVFVNILRQQRLER